MHDIEPYYHWRDLYVASEDSSSPFFGKVNSEFSFANKIYNYYIHPQWDEFGSSTLYMKLLFCEYDQGFAVIELIGEWNDCIHNDIMFLKRNIADFLLEQGISKFILLADNVLNFHGGDDDYYQEWFEDVADREGWVVILETRNHVENEMRDAHLHHYVQFGDVFESVNWRRHQPSQLFQIIDEMVWQGNRQLPA